MCALSNRIREEPIWWEKLEDEESVERWREEIPDQAGNDEVEKTWKLTPAMVRYVLEELQGYADLRDPETGIEVGPAERIWKSDKLIPSSLKERLLAAVVPLESVPGPNKDWHPGSDGFVLDLVNPFLYPIVLESTMDSGPEPSWFPRCTSRKFQWLPSDFFVDPDGDVTLTSPYINNINPTLHKDLYAVIPEILQRAVPMFERALSDTIRPLLRMRIATSVQQGQWFEETADCIWDGVDSHSSARPKKGRRKRVETGFGGNAFRTPDARLYGGDLEVMKDRISLRGRTIQVIVKLSNIVLTPEKPCYPGGRWHVEGIRNESIVSSFVYYYDSENITESRLGFRRATSGPPLHHEDDDICPKVLYDMGQHSTLVQDIGDVVTKADRCIAFPNLYQRQVQPFELMDPAKPGHRKVLIFFLVDPTQKIPSATDIASQQREWVIDAMRGVGANSPFARLPVEILKMISEEIDGTVSRLDSEKYREEMMAERIGFDEQISKDYFGVELDME